MRARSWLLVVLLASGCHDADDDIRADVRLVCNHDGVVADAATAELARFGRRAIPTIEAAMHTAAPPARKKLVLALARIGDGEAAPLLGHLAVYDGSADVRREAEATLRHWAGDGAAAARATRARAALRLLEEARGVEGAG